EDVFLDCAYHELLHAFGLSNHDQHNPWTTLNQNRTVGYLTIYDRFLLALLYDPRIRPGMTAAQVRAVLPHILASANRERWVRLAAQGRLRRFARCVRRAGGRWISRHPPRRRVCRWRALDQPGNAEPSSGPARRQSAAGGHASLRH